MNLGCPSRPTGEYAGQHDPYCVKHPRQSGYVVYCADCHWVAEGETEKEAKANWNAGKRTEKSFDRGELVD